MASIINGTASPGHLPLPSRNTPEAKRRLGLNALCVIELVFVIWSIFFLHWQFVIALPIDMLGIIAVRRMQKNLLTAFAFTKSLYMAFVIITFVTCSYCTYDFFYLLIVVTVVLMQMVGIVLSTKIRRDILLAENIANIELTYVDQTYEQQGQFTHLPQYPSSGFPSSGFPAAGFPSSGMPTQHFQDPHATAGVPGYPYPPQQFYPTPYMNQGYPTPYAHYPQAQAQVPVSTYPSYTISDDQQQQQSQSHLSHSLPLPQSYPPPPPSQSQSQQPIHFPLHVDHPNDPSSAHVPDTHPLLHSRE